MQTYTKIQKINWQDWKQIYINILSFDVNAMGGDSFVAT